MMVHVVLTPHSILEQYRVEQSDVILRLGDRWKYWHAGSIDERKGPDRETILVS